MLTLIIILQMAQSFCGGYKTLQKNFLGPEKMAEKKYPLIFMSKNWKASDFETIAKSLSDKQVMVIGEIHDDTKGHRQIKKLIKFLSTRYKIGFSMEMIEQDQELVLKEYLLNFLNERSFRHSAKLPNNYRSQYEPIVKEAKKLNIPIYAANVPRRYASLVARKGLGALKNLPKESYKYLPPYSIIIPDETKKTKKYRDKLRKIFKSHKMEEKRISNMVQAQFLWDASMSYNVSRLVKENPGRKIIHLVGRFHSDYYMGMVERLQKMGLEVLTLSIFPVTPKDEINKEMAKIADFVIISGIRRKVKKMHKKKGKEHPVKIKEH